MIPLVHFEIHAADIERAKTFYNALFGWDYSVWKGPAGADGQPFEYHMIMTKVEGKGIDGGFVQRRGDAPAEGAAVNAFVCTMEVESVEATVAAALAAGGSVAMPATVIAGVGILAYCKDTEGNIFGLMQAEKKGAM